MKSVALVVALSLLASADALVSKRVSSLELKVPAVWKQQVDEGTHRWEAPSEDATFSLDVFPVEGDPLEPGECRAKLVAALGGEGWENLSLGAAPAARRIYLDSVEGAGEVETWSYVGCDGRTKWALTFVMSAKKKDRYATLVGKIVESVRYRKGAAR
jgi:hypothetical protein